MLALLLAFACTIQDGPRAPLASGVVRSVELESPAGTFVRYYRMDGPGGAGAPPVLLLRYLAGPDSEGGTRVESEFLWLADGLRLLHCERAFGARRQLVFRELGPRSGRTFFLQGDAVHGYEATELGGPEVVRRSFAEGGEFPLLLLEGVRRGLAAPGEARVLDPLGAAFEPLTLVRSGGFEQRTLEARRADGSLRFGVTLRGDEPIEWAWQDGAARARRIEREEYERWRGEHELARRVAEEAAARTLRGGR